MGGLGGTDGQPEHHSPKGGGSMILRADHRLKQKREWPPTAVCFPISHQKLSSWYIRSTPSGDMLHLLHKKGRRSDHLSTATLLKEGGRGWPKQQGEAPAG